MHLLEYLLCAEYVPGLRETELVTSSGLLKVHLRCLLLLQHNICVHVYACVYVYIYVYACVHIYGGRRSQETGYYTFCKGSSKL